MTFQQSAAYPEAAMQFQTYMDGTAMDSSAGNNLIDPNLKAALSPTHTEDSCDPPQIQRFLTDNCNPMCMGYQQRDPKFPGSLGSTHNGVAPTAPDSPPLTHPSSTCSGALSPAMESDYYHVRSPPTPTDSQIWPTFPNHCDSWDSHSQFYSQRTGLAPDCVKPGDLYPYQDTYDDNIVRGLSMSSDDCSSNGDQWSPSELSQMSQQMSPVTTHFAEVKEEIYITEPHFTPVYPGIETEDEAHSADEVDEDTHVKIEDEDEEYQPGKKPKRANAPTSRTGKTQKRTSSSLHTTPQSTKRVKTEPNNTAISNIATVKASLKGAKRNFPCKECRDIVFKDEHGLQKHIKTQHTRPFICVFHFAGCTSTFASKNEWKRHCASQHLLLSYWLCQQELCAKVTNAHSHSHTTSSSNKSSSGGPWQCEEGNNILVPALPNGAIFNRKDLYTQHLRRMHVPPSVKKLVKQKKPVPEWEDNVRAYQEGAHRIRCHLPSRMDCPAAGCQVEFEGPNAWDERMEHVAKHLDKASSGSGDSTSTSTSTDSPSSSSPFTFGGEEDATLIAWATRPEVDIIRKDDKGKWVLHNPLRPTGHPRKGMAASTGDEDEDAEGEEFDE